MGYCTGKGPIYSRMTFPDRDPSQPQPLEDVGTIPELNLFEVKRVEAVFNQLTFAQDMLRYLVPSGNSTLLTTSPALTCLILTTTYYTSCFNRLSTFILRIQDAFLR